VSARQTSAVFTTMANISQKNKVLSLWEIETLVYDHQIYDTDNKTLWHTGPRSSGPSLLLSPV